jgi:hypothetical protein
MPELTRSELFQFFSKSPCLAENASCAAIGSIIFGMANLGSNGRLPLLVVERLENAVRGVSGVAAEPKLRQNSDGRGKTRLRAPESDDAAGATKGF